jgi:hypothetical protein
MRLCECVHVCVRACVICMCVCIIVCMCGCYVCMCGCYVYMYVCVCVCIPNTPQCNGWGMLPHSQYPRKTTMVAE